MIIILQNNIDIDVTEKIKESIKNATILKKEFFVTKNKFQLVMNRKEAVSIYQNPISNAFKKVIVVVKSIHAYTIERSNADSHFCNSSFFF